MKEPNQPALPPRELTPGTSAFDRRCAELARVLFHEWANGCCDFEPIDQDHADGLIGQIRNLLMRELHRANKEHAQAMAEKDAKLRIEYDDKCRIQSQVNERDHVIFNLEADVASRDAELTRLRELVGMAEKGFLAPVNTLRGLYKAHASKSGSVVVGRDFLHSLIAELEDSLAKLRGSNPPVNLNEGKA